jgi:hypothetical protein
MNPRKAWSAARAAALLFALAAGTLSAAACSSNKRDKVGQSCRDLGRATTCIDREHVLVCRGYSWHVDACRGPNGCSGAPDHAQCDARVADEGDGCGERGKTTCTRDRKALLECNGSTFILASTCRGPNGCTPADSNTGTDAGSDTDTARSAHCDARLAREGDPCVVSRTRMASSTISWVKDRALASHNGHLQPDQTAACSVDGNAELVCADGAFVLFKTCRGGGNRGNGGKGCTIHDRDHVTCNDSIAAPGDPCRAQSKVCGADGRTSLACSDWMNGRYAVASTCDGPAGCVSHPGGQAVDCDDSVAEPGDPCTSNGSMACNHDAKKLLRCGPHVTCRLGSHGAHQYIPSGGPPVFAEIESCPRGCKVTRKPDGNGYAISVQCK